MKLTQGTKSVSEYLQAFNNLARYASESVDTDAKKIASFKIGLSPKLMKTMGCKCTTFNEFISDTITQENNNTIYVASKSRKRAYEAGASQSKASVASKPLYRPPTANIRYRPPVRKTQTKTGFCKRYTIALPKNTSGQGSSNPPSNNRPCWNCNHPGHWARDCPHPPKKTNQNQGYVRQGRVHFTTVEEILAGEVVVRCLSNFHVNLIQKNNTIKMMTYIKISIVIITSYILI
jgi:hypothetical protein